MIGGLLSRRDLFKGGILIAGFSLLGAPSPAAAQSETGGGKTLALNSVDSFLAIDEKGTVTVFSGKVDLGTGIRTALCQIVADELDVPLAAIAIVMGDTDLTPNQGPTYGSLSIQNGGVQLRNAAAAARNALLELAAAKLGIKPEELTSAGGFITGGGKSIGYGELIGGQSFALAIDPKAPPKTKNPAEFQFAGKSVPRLDIPAKVTGTFTYMHDFQVPDMLHGRVIRPPSLGAMLENVEEESIANIPGIVQIVREGSFLGIVAENEWAAIKAALQLKASWSSWEGLPDRATLFETVRGTYIVRDDITGDTGDSAAAMAAEGAKTLSATYDFAIHTHGSIGPSCAIASFKDGKLTTWSASQATHNLQKQLAKMFELASGDVRCIHIEGAGCYGRNGHEDAAADAALLARSVGKPVRVQWSRADEHGWDPKGPPVLADLKAALDGSRIAAWESEFFLPNQTQNVTLVPLLAATLAGLPADETVSPGNLAQNSNIPYKFPNIKTICHRLESTPFRTSWIRTPGRTQNTFANESFLDELASAVGADPLEFRLKHLDPADERAIEALTRVAALAKWDKRASPKAGSSGAIFTGRGISYVKYDLARTYVAAVAEVEVRRKTGEIRVTRFFVAHDCGQIINPDGLRNQIEGNIVQTVSRTLIEEVKFDQSSVTSLDWASYPILTFPKVPEIVLDLIDRPGEKPWGAGEPSGAAVPAAVSNAVFDAAGIRLRSVPFTPDKVRRALGQAKGASPIRVP
jgi:nicotinate dehydrogenase subunit B